MFVFLFKTCFLFDHLNFQLNVSHVSLMNVEVEQVWTGSQHRPHEDQLLDNRSLFPWQREAAAPTGAAFCVHMESGTVPEHCSDPSSVLIKIQYIIFHSTFISTG